MNGIKIKGMGRCVPAHVVTNDDLSKIMDTNDEWTNSGRHTGRSCASRIQRYQ